MTVQRKEFTLTTRVLMILGSLASGENDETQRTPLESFCQMSSDKVMWETINRVQASIIAKAGIPKLKSSLDDLFRIFDAIAQLLPDAEVQSKLSEIVSENQPAAVIEEALKTLASGELLRIGRDPDKNDIVFVNDLTVSREHCKITKQDDGSLAITGKSTGNGTFVNGALVDVEPVALNTGDCVKLGGAILEFTVPKLTCS
ncbi:MAG: FHA domain-containing protein [Cyanobacteria bacterium]|nr:FHA domain-containing protein [Cyanobacteriota bacterium]